MGSIDWLKDEVYKASIPVISLWNNIAASEIYTTSIRL